MRRLQTTLCIAICLAATTAPAAGIRTLKGKHLTLYTDVPSSPEVDELPEVFDQAFGQWCEYFHLDPVKHADWKPNGYLIRAREHFTGPGMHSDKFPPFRNGHTIGMDLWLNDQTSPYYRRHLLLHEGVHCIMRTLLGGVGPAWYAEGMAELLGTHRWEDGRLKVNYFPLRRAEVPKLGRIELVQTAFSAKRAQALTKILGYDSSAHSENEAYAWCWAATALLDGHPRYRDRFRQLPKFAGAGNFGQQFFALYDPDMPRLLEDWQLLVANMDYGYDFERMSFEPVPGKPLLAGGAKVSVAADRGWQPSGVRLEAGRTYQLTASGRYQVDDTPDVWWCEPGGVTIEYVAGLPLGVLLGAVRPDEPDAKASSPLIRPQVIGTAATITPKETGTLYLRINDWPGKLRDNAGSATVEVKAAKGS